MTKETWLPIDGLPDYEVSDQGRVRSWKQYRGQPGPRFLTSRTSPTDDHLAYKFSTPVGAVIRTGHALVLRAFVGPRPEWAEHIRHLDGDPTNNVLSNLRYGTPSENQLDSVRHGTHPMARKTHCKEGHEYTPTNTYITPRGKRDCRICRREAQRRCRVRSQGTGAAA